MPFKSQAQRRKFYHLKSIGKMNQKTIDEWEKDTPSKLPERLTKKAFWAGFIKAADESMGGKGFSSVGKSQNQYLKGQLENDQLQGTISAFGVEEDEGIQHGHGHEQINVDRGPDDYNYGNIEGKTYANDYIPTIRE